MSRKLFNKKTDSRESFFHDLQKLLMIIATQKKTKTLLIWQS